MTLYRFDQIAENIRVPAMPKPEDSERYIGLEHMDSGSLRIKRWGTERALDGQKLAMKKGDVLFAKRNAYIRRVAVAPFDGLFSAHGMVLRAKTDVCLHEFLPVFMSSDYFMERAIKISVGSLSPTINWSSLNREEFEIPSLDEQHRIADLLWAADDVIQRQSEAYEKLLVVKQATIDILFTKGVNGKHKKFQTTKLGEIPENWKLEKLEDVTTKIVDGVHKRPDYVEVGIPFVTVENLSQSREIDLANARRISQKDHEEFFKRCNPEKGDVLVTKDGTLGIAKLVKTDEIFGVFVSVALLKPNRSKLDGRYLKAFFDSSIFKRRLSGKTSGSALKHIHLVDFRSTLLPLPDLKEQIEIVEVLDEIDNQVDFSFAHIENCINLKKALISNSIG